MLEGSKAFAKEFMARHNIPTAGYREFSSETIDEGKEYLRNQSTPIVLKADGLAAGKGVILAQTVEEAEAAVEDMLAGNAFGAYICYGVALIFAGQAFVNMGVSSGLLPTKGLTLPFVSYGGSSLIVCCAMLGMVLRIDRDTRVQPRTRRAV